MSKPRAAILLVVAVETGLLLAGCSRPTAVPSPAPTSSPAAQTPPPLLSPTGQASDATRPASLPVPSSFRALGTEPFWSAEYSLGKVTWSTPDEPDGVIVQVTRRDADGRATLTGALDGRAFELNVRQETCSDGMSDTVYPLSVVRKIDDDIQAGCGR